MRPALLFAALLTSTLALAQEPDPWEHRSWIAKAGRVLRAGSALTLEEIEALAPLSKEEVVAELMRAPAFGDAVLDFNLYFLGVKPNILYYPGEGTRYYTQEVWSKP